MQSKTLFTPKQVGRCIKEFRNDLGISMPELGWRVSVNKSTIKRYEAEGIAPKRTMIINGLAEVLLTTPLLHPLRQSDGGNEPHCGGRGTEAVSYAVCH